MSPICAPRDWRVADGEDRGRAGGRGLPIHAYSAFFHPAFPASYYRQNSPAAVSVVSRRPGRRHRTIHILLLSVFVLLFCLCSVWGRRVGGII